MILILSPHLFSSPDMISLLLLIFRRCRCLLIRHDAAAMMLILPAFFWRFRLPLMVTPRRFRCLPFSLRAAACRFHDGATLPPLRLMPPAPPDADVARFD